MAGDKTITALIVENKQSEYAVDIEVSGHKIIGDEPIDFGGKDLGPAPYDLLTAALGECTAMTVRWFAKQQNWPLEKVEVKITHHKEKLPEQKFKSDIFNKEIILHGDLSEEQKTKLIEIAAKCPVHRTLESDVIIQTK